MANKNIKYNYPKEKRAFTNPDNTIEVNMIELANILVNHLNFNISTDEINIIDTLANVYDEVLNDYLAGIIPEGQIITALDYELLRDELAIFIKVEIFRRVHRIINKIEPEDDEIFKVSIKQYEVEQDGN